eukprot:TRINITY_DN2722_c0_g1_i3.p1 TRINITY_DN2722_c0_g1~~TRINITY_DN2722_c0_g1_i3.p1  ORF type:complete len:355 (+),score=55.92 TRINITY_DN2722_c0_g1_i3:100-1164(+)
MLQQGALKLPKISYLIFDEADRMLDMGFRPQIDEVVSYLGSQPRQTLFFSATWPREVREIAIKYVTRDQVRIFIGDVEESLVANKNIEQIILQIEDREKVLETQKILDDHPNAKVLIFVNQKLKCEDLKSQIRGHRCVTIHGDKRQEERDRALTSFRQGRATVLIATDVASRGLDITDITEIINFDFPTAMDDYVHRIGRTARASNTGKAFSFFTYADSKFASDLIKVIQQADQQVPDFLYDMSGSGGFSSRGGRGGGRRGGGRGGGRSSGGYGGSGNNNYGSGSNSGGWGDDGNYGNNGNNWSNYDDYGNDGGWDGGNSRGGRGGRGSRGGRSGGRGGNSSNYSDRQYQSDWN